MRRRRKRKQKTRRIETQTQTEAEAKRAETEVKRAETEVKKAETTRTNAQLLAASVLVAVLAVDWVMRGNRRFCSGKSNATSRPRLKSVGADSGHE